MWREIFLRVISQYQFYTFTYIYIYSLRHTYEHNITNAEITESTLSKKKLQSLF